MYPYSVEVRVIPSLYERKALHPYVLRRKDILPAQKTPVLFTARLIQAQDCVSRSVSRYHRITGYKTGRMRELGAFGPERSYLRGASYATARGRQSVT